MAHGGKLGGFARLTGGPANFKGASIRSPQEQIGQGKVGLKSWGECGSSVSVGE
jgi:hypothetical protein